MKKLAVACIQQKVVLVVFNTESLSIVVQFVFSSGVYLWSNEKLYLGWIVFYPEYK